MKLDNIQGLAGNTTIPAITKSVKSQEPASIAGVQSRKISTEPEISDKLEILMEAPLGKTADVEQVNQQISVQSVNPEPSLKLSDIPPMEKDLYQVNSDGTTTKVTFIYDAGGRSNIDNLTLMGSWDKNTGKYSNKWVDSAVKMTQDKKGRWIAQVELENKPDVEYQWGVLADSPIGKQTWAVFEEGELLFKPEAGQKTGVAEYSPTTYHKMGCTKDGNNADFRYWAPNAKSVSVRIWDKDPDNVTLVPLQKDPKTGMWAATIEDSWNKIEGKSYGYQLVTSEGVEILRADPYARYHQGQQKGIADLYLNPKTGQQVHQYCKEPSGEFSWQRFLRFEIQDHANADAAYLKLYDASGEQMNKEQLIERIGKGNPELIEKFHKGKLNDHWLNNTDENGNVSLVKQDEAWSVIFNDPVKLPGLVYKLEVHEKGSDGQLKIVGDSNYDGVLSFGEAKNTNYNDPFTPVISEKIGWERHGIIKAPSHEWKNDNAPRMAPTKEKQIIYQMHVGSVFGKEGNLKRSTFKDVIERLEYFKEMGANTLEILPTNTFEGQRDWGYIGTSTMAQTEQYGFVDDKGNWVNGADAVMQFVDAAHGMGFNVINDVVYNHWGGDFNQLWKHDGKKNPYFDWDPNPKLPEGTSNKDQEKWLINEGEGEAAGIVVDSAGEKEILKPDPLQKPAKTKEEEMTAVHEPDSKSVRHTDWGAMPAYNKEPVRQFIVDHAMSQLDEFHFDGLRFDFTHPIHAQGWGGGSEGWTLLKRINRQLHYFHPNATTAAEEFPNSEPITKPAQTKNQGGAGFDQMWNTEFQHRLVHDNGRPGLLQQAAHKWRTDMDAFMHHLINRPGFSIPMNSTTVITNHDEVGNADRTINTAMNHQLGKMPDQWERNATRLTFGIGMLSPGVAIYFQGEESLATNRFKWGTPTTWDVGWDWKEAGKNLDWGKVEFNQAKVDKFNELLSIPDNKALETKLSAMSHEDRELFKYVVSQDSDDKAEMSEVRGEKGIMDIMRKQHNLYCSEVTKLRANNVAFDGDAEVRGIYTHNDNSVMAFTRKKADQEFLVIGSFNHNNQGDYNIPLDGGKWKLVFNSDASFFGGENFGSKMDVDGNHGSRFDIPKGGLLVYKRVG